MSKEIERVILIDPPSAAYYEDRLFNDLKLNRDGVLEPFRRLKCNAEKCDISMHTADYYRPGKFKDCEIDYYSFGITENYQTFATNNDINIKGFYLLEPPVVQPDMYKQLPELTKYFTDVYVHNTHGDGYSLQGVEQRKLKKIYWPQPLNSVKMECWKNSDRSKRIVTINGNHRPRSADNELYSERIKAMVALEKFGSVDLYGFGWDKLLSKTSLWLPYLKNRAALLRIYQGPCESKYSVLSQYQYSLCFENMVMDGYITEKIFDCFYAGTIPLYLGQQKIEKTIPKETFIDCREYQSWADLWEYLRKLPENKINEFRAAGRKFLNTADYLQYYNFLDNTIIGG